MVDVSAFLHIIYILLKSILYYGIVRYEEILTNVSVVNPGFINFDVMYDRCELININILDDSLIFLNLP